MRLKQTGFYLWVYNHDWGIEYKLYDSDPFQCTEDAPLTSISIPLFCEERRARLGIFLKEFSTLLNEMLVCYDREKVALLCKEVMTELFPEEMPDYELGFYERYGGVYCTIQYSAEGHKKVFGTERHRSYAEMLGDGEGPLPKRLQFQERNEIWEKWNAERWRRRIKIIEGKAGRQLRHPRKDGGLREYLDREFIEKQEESEPSGVGRV